MPPAEELPGNPAGVGQGVLYVIATPIGNRGDFSPRAVETLRSCDLIAVEDTRKVRRLLDPHGSFSAPLQAYHEHNELALAPRLADRIAAGQRVALLSEAGTPAVSDPGFRLVRECRRRGLPVSPIPGPSAAVAALSVSGLPSDGFLFLGFLPPKGAARRRIFEQYRDFPHTLIFYESTHRILKFLDDVVAVLGEDRILCVAREITKQYETILTGPAQDLANTFNSQSTKGEFVVLIAKAGFAL